MIESLTLALIQSNWSQDHALVVADWLEEQEEQKSLADYLRDKKNLTLLDMDVICYPYKHDITGFFYGSKHWCLLGTKIVVNGIIEEQKIIDKQQALAFLCDWKATQRFHHSVAARGRIMEFFLKVAKTQKWRTVPKEEIRKWLQDYDVVPSGELQHLLSEFKI